jgi:uncharacterized protein (TIGR02594 family)
MKISNKYDWLGSVVNPPKMVALAIQLGKLNTNEIPGPKSNPEVMKLAEIAGVKSLYTNDDIAWCAVAHSALAIQAGKELPFSGVERLRAKSFLKFGVHSDEPMFGDTCIFVRPGGYHVGWYVGEDDTYYHIGGGNQGNQYSVVRIYKERLLEARRPIYKTGQPASVQKIFLDASGMTSTNES